MGHPRCVQGLIAAAVIGLVMSGCGQNELGRYTGYQPNMWVVKDPKRIRNKIVKSENYWIQKEVEPEEQFPGPTPDDLESPEEDYILGPGDLIDISVFELMQPGQPYVTRQRVSQSGRVTFPYLGTIKCAGLTTHGLEEKLGDLLEPEYLVDPQVTVFVTEYRNLSVSMLNGVARPGLYPMNKQDMTLLELVAMAGGILQLTEDYGYVIREYSPDEADLLMLEGRMPPPEEEAAEEGGADEPAEAAEPAPETPAPDDEPAGAEAAPEPASVAPEPAESDPSATGALAGTDPAEVRELLERMAEGQMPEVRQIEAAEATHLPGPAAGSLAAAMAPEPPAPAGAPARAAPAGDDEELSRWIWSDGKWIEVKPKKEEGEAPTEQPPAEKPAEPQEGPEPTPAEKPEAEPVRIAQTTPPGEGQVAEQGRLDLEQKLRRLGVVQGSGQLRRIIRFDVEALQAGDPTQNVVLRDSDIVTIPSPPVGDFYMAGEVARPGVYSLTGRKITLLQAVAAAGGLTAVAVPWRTELVRRISETEEEIIYVDLGKVSRGESPDFYIKPEDQIRVGTDQGAVYNAVLRNAFRATYGLGFVYDMNYADFYPWTDNVSPIFDTPF
ncbi:MAG: polysaccharide biosynthesis/export family protein [Phycisphaerae bacterium]